jgi:hypothetical protein
MTDHPAPLNVEQLILNMEGRMPTLITRVINDTVPVIIKQQIAPLEQEVHKLGVLYEDLDERYRADSEILRSSFNMKDAVETNTSRLDAIEAIQALLVATVTEHSKKLATA